MSYKVEVSPFIPKGYLSEDELKLLSLMGLSASETDTDELFLYSDSEFSSTISIDDYDLEEMGLKGDYDDEEEIDLYHLLQNAIDREHTHGNDAITHIAFRISDTASRVKPDTVHAFFVVVTKEDILSESLRDVADRLTSTALDRLKFAQDNENSLSPR